MRTQPISRVTPRSRPAVRRRGMAAVIAMLFLVLMTTLALAMYCMATMNVRTAANYSDAERARSIAESGLRWMSWRFTKMNRPKTTIGSITAPVAASLWSSIQTSVSNDLATMLNAAERPTTFDGTTLSSSPIAVDESNGRFVITVRQHPLNAGDPLDQTYLRVSSTGTYGKSSRTLSMDFKIDKKVKYAIVGKVPIQIGRNTLVDGPIATTINNFSKGPPVYMLSDFRHLTPALQTKIDNFDSFLQAHHNGYDNRINVNNATEYAAATTAGYTDYNGDGFIDEYDLFLKEFDSNGDKQISKAEFTNPATGLLYDPDLFTVIDSLGGPMFTGDTTRAGYKDNLIANNDGYTKVRGTISLVVTAAAWQANLAGSGQTIQSNIVGPIEAATSTAQPVQFATDPTTIFDLTPSDFDTSAYRLKTGPENGATTKSGTVFTNYVLTAADANGGTANEQTPWGSTSWQATYQRPVFQNMTFNNCRIPKGLNARFSNCTFNGVTFVDLNPTILNSSNQPTTNASDGMAWSQKMKSGSFSNTTVLTATNSSGFSEGNNLRFDNCLIHGPLASSVPTAYTHFGNSWEFTGSTLFDNQADQTATLLCPNTNIEMGSFTDPAAAPSTLIGVCVTGNIDIRGSSVVDGSIIVTGDGAGNTTQGWFGPSDSNTDATSAMPEGGYGRLYIRYNPYRVCRTGSTWRWTFSPTRPPTRSKP